MNWLQLQVQASGAHTERISTVLEAFGALAVSVAAADDEALLEPAPGEQPVWQHNTITGLFSATTDALRLTAGLKQELAGLILCEPVLDSLEDQDWINAWRELAVPREFAKGLWVIPTDGVAPAGARTVVRLDPGLAFGSGAHPTTALCLQWLSQCDVQGCRVIDYGCGSGILAIAAALMGARQVIAVDYDPQALTATLSNARLNDVADRIEVYAPGDVPQQQAEYVVANILANALFELCDDLALLACPGAGLALSGILPEQVSRLQCRYQTYFNMQPPITEQEWVLMAGVRQAGTQ